MKYLSWFLVFVFVVSCKPVNQPISKAETVAKDSIVRFDQLRKLYASGDPNIWPKAEVDSMVLANGFEDIGVLGEIPFPNSNPYSKEKYELGKLLFHDPRLSSSNQIACASCHDPQLGWGDGKRVAFGHDRQTGKRNAMTLFNVAYYDSLFWDGRAVSLEHQATMPIEDSLEMHQELGIATDKIAKIKGYNTYFKKAYGDSKVTRARIMKAIATFERKIKSPKSRFDRFILGNEKALNNSELLGLHLFRTKARCINCHNTPLFSDNRFHNDGQTLFGSANEDLGRYKVTTKKEDVGKFKTPSLREVVQTGPWMHNGNFPTLVDVVEFYNLGNPAPIQKKYTGTARDSLLPKTSPLLQELHLTAVEKQALLDFLETITTRPQRLKAPVLPK